MQKVHSNIHTHSTFSDGKSTMEEQVQAAIGFGFHTLGLSDHSFTACDTSYCMHPDRLPTYRAEIAALQAKYPQIDLIPGLEVDVFTAGDPGAFDYTLSAVHYILKDGVYWSVDHSEESMDKGIREGFGGDWLTYARTYFAEVGELVPASGRDIAAHFDLVTKFRKMDTENPAYRAAALDALDAVLDKEMLIEVNTGAIARGYRTTPYPSPFLLERIRERGGRVILGSDCHDCTKLQCAFERAEDILRGCGFRSVWELRRQNGKAVFTETAL